METVEVVIKIPKEIIDHVNKFGTIFYNEYISYIADELRTATTLPKGHGRLFILDERLVKEFFTSFSFSCQKWISEVDISKATLKVIETDKEVSE